MGWIAAGTTDVIDRFMGWISAGTADMIDRSMGRLQQVQQI